MAQKYWIFYYYYYSEGTEPKNCTGDPPPSPPAVSSVQSVFKRKRKKTNKDNVCNSCSTEQTLQGLTYSLGSGTTSSGTIVLCNLHRGWIIIWVKDKIIVQIRRWKEVEEEEEWGWGHGNPVVCLQYCVNSEVSDCQATIKKTTTQVDGQLMYTKCFNTWKHYENAKYYSFVTQKVI